MQSSREKHPIAKEPKKLKFKMNKMNSELEITNLHCFESLLEKKIFINKWNPKARYL